jgi:hypothetical protein
MGQGTIEHCPICNRPLVFSLPPGGAGPRTFQCFDCDRQDPLESWSVKRWLEGELGARGGMKFVEPRPFADPNVAARKLVEIASTIEPVQNGRIYIELVNAPFLKAGGSAGEYRAGLDRAIAKGWLIHHESGTYVRFTEAGAALFA